MSPDDLPETAPRPDAAVSQPVANFARRASFLGAVDTLAGRWSTGQPAHGLRGKKGGVS